MKKLSIIIPHYNSAESLIKLLNSIPKIDDIQTIVVDDNSDKDLELFNKIKKNSIYSHITFIKNNSDKKGAGVCRNIGLDMAIGKWVLFADSDDYFVEDFYTKISKYFFSDNDIIYFTPTSIEVDTGKKSDRHLLYEERIDSYLKNKNLQSELFLKYHFVVPWSKLIKRNLIVENNITFDETLVSNDIMFSTKVGYYIKKFDVTRDIIYCVTRNKGSLTTNISQKIFDIRFEVFIDYCKFIKLNLNKEEYYELDLCGIVYIINALKYKLGLKTLLSTYIILKKNKIRILGRKHTNINHIKKKISFNYNEYKNTKRYFVKHD